MKYLLCLPLFVLVTACGSANPHEAAMEKAAGVMEDLAGVVEGVKTKADAEAAASKLKAIGERMEPIAKTIEKIGEPSKELKDKFESRFKKIGERIQGAMSSMSPDVMAALQKPMMGLFAKMQSFPGGK